MKIIEYCIEGVATPDFKVIDTVRKFFATDHVQHWKISTDNVIWAIKSMVTNQEISYDSFEFRFQGKKVEINKYGAILRWPDGFADFQASLTQKTLRYGAERRQKERRRMIDA